MDERGRQADGGQSSEVQDSLDPGRDRNNKVLVGSAESSRAPSQEPETLPGADPVVQSPAHLPPIPEHPVQPGDEAAELDKLKKNAADSALNANNALVEYKKALEAAENELEQAKEMETYITTVADEARARLTDIKQSFQNANGVKDSTKTVL
jgi:hypothetical protein